MTIATSFALRAPIDAAWRALLDVPGIAHCLPGVELTSVLPDRTYAGRVELRVGPLRLAYAGRVQIVEVDDDRHTVRMTARGDSAVAGQGMGATVRARLTSEGGDTRVVMEADIPKRGVLARMGSGKTIDMVVRRMSQGFANCLERQLSASA